MQLDISKLKGDYYTGFGTIKSKINCALIPSSARDEILEDIYEMLLRNQNSKKDFLDVIGGNLSTFIDNIIDSYASTISRTNFILSVIKTSFLFAILGLIGTLFTNTITISTIVYSLIGFIVGGLTYLFIYKIKKNSINLISYIIAGLFGVFNTSVINSLNESSTFLSTNLSYTLLLVIFILELIPILLIQNYLKKIS